MPSKFSEKITSNKKWAAKLLNKQEINIWGQKFSRSYQETAKIKEYIKKDLETQKQDIYLRRESRRTPGWSKWSSRMAAGHQVCESEVSQSCPTLCDPMDCSPPGSSVHGIFQARILEWVAISFSRGSSRPRDWTWVSHITGRRFTIKATNSE